MIIILCSIALRDGGKGRIDMTMMVKKKAKTKREAITFWSRQILTKRVSFVLLAMAFLKAFFELITAIEPSPHSETYILETRDPFVISFTSYG